MKKLHFFFFLSLGTVISLLILTGFIAQATVIPEMKSQEIWTIAKVFGYGVAAIFVGIVIVVLIKYIEMREGKSNEENN